MPKLTKLIDSLWLAAIQNFPDEIGFRLRYKYWKRRLKFLGQGVRIDCSVHLQTPSLISIDDNCWIDRGVLLLAGLDQSNRRRRWSGPVPEEGRGEIRIGRNVHIGAYSIVSGIDAGVIIGNDCTLSSHVKMFAFSHDYRFADRPDDRSCAFGSMVSLERQSLIAGQIELGDNVGVATSVVVLPGVQIGKDSFVGVGAVVSHGEFPENSRIAGQPAKVVGSRFAVPKI